MSGRRSIAGEERRGAMRKKNAKEEEKKEEGKYDTPVKANRVVVVRKKKTTTKRHEDSCPACAATGGKLRYPPGPLPDLPLRSRYTSPAYRLRQQPPPALLLPAPAASASATPDSTAAAAPFPPPSPSQSQSGFISPKQQQHHLSSGLPSPAHSSSNPLLSHAHSSSSPYNFSLSVDEPPSSRVRCRVDYLHRDFAVDFDLHDPSLNDAPASFSSHVRRSSDSTTSSRKPRPVNLDGPKKFSLRCYHPKEPDKNYKFHVELFKTSTKGYGLRVIQCPPKIKGTATPGAASSPMSGSVDRGDPDKPPPSYAIDVRNFSSTNHGSISKGGGNTGIFVRPRDLADMDEVRISSGKLSSKGDEEEQSRREDECRCITPCGAAHCKAH